MTVDPPNHYADIFIAICYGVCFLVGISGNIVSLRYFLSEPRTLSNLLYRVISMNDIWISNMAFPVMLSIANRKPMMFSSAIFCSIWGALWKVFLQISVCLVCIMSISRTYTMMFPFRRINKKWIQIGFVCYMVFLIIFHCLILMVIAKYIFTTSDCYCWSDMRDHVFGWIHIEDLESFVNSLNTCLLAVPVLPVSMSCGISVFLLNRDIKLGNSQSQSVKAKHKATKTIIIITSLYIVCNVPVAVLWVKWMLSLHTYPEPYFTSTFMYFYSWNVLGVLSACVNSVANPIVYITRNNMFKKHVIRKISTI